MCNNYCISCHSAQNNNLFLKKWNTNKSVTEISKTIKNGIVNTEMIGFQKTLSDEEVFNLASYIIKNFNETLDFEAANNV